MFASRFDSKSLVSNERGGLFCVFFYAYTSAIPNFFLPPFDFNAINNFQGFI